MFSPNSLDLRCAWQVSLLVWLPYCAALLLLLSSSLPGWCKLPLALAVLYCGHRAGRLHGRLAEPYSLVRLSLTDKRPRECEIWERNGQRFWARILPESLVTARLVLLSIQLPSGKRRLLILTHWNTDPEPFRRLRITLRMQSPPRSARPDKGAPAE